jgi:hypothetical protein
VEGAEVRDPVGDFLAAYAEYLDGRRLYEDLPPAFATCPTLSACNLTICMRCNPGTATLYERGRVVSAMFRLREERGR